MVPSGTAGPKRSLPSRSLHTTTHNSNTDNLKSFKGAVCELQVHKQYITLADFDIIQTQLLPTEPRADPHPGLATTDMWPLNLAKLLQIDLLFFIGINKTTAAAAINFVSDSM